MPLRHKCARNTDTIVIASSSDTSEASEDSFPEPVPDSPASHGGFAAENDMSERQTWKINAGSFGMFNHPTLMPTTTAPPPRTPEKGKKRKRVKEYSYYKGSPRTRRREERRAREEIVELSDEGEGEHSLFVSEGASRIDLVIVEGEFENDLRLYSGMTPERARNAKEYLDVLSLVHSADQRLRTTESALGAMASEHKGLEWKLANIDATAENKISDILRQRDEAVRIAEEHADEKIKRVRERLPAKKQNCEEMLRDVAGRRSVLEERVVEVKAELEVVKGKETELEQQGGFELCSDVREVQARGNGDSR
ncbi:hypothetical protein E8E12_009678 [Didymella heteroderae]|uniref:Uncharacterized protein n=1 Tax=Didymella heteroderae TaxID=1769908 RepID=A0A9P5C341_9PLEO|nr:hypothetical protein E8E12_009678 [Didymella heteroderae]